MYFRIQQLPQPNGAFPLHRQSPTFLAPRTSFVENHFSMDKVRGWLTQCCEQWRARELSSRRSFTLAHSPPAVWPGFLTGQEPSLWPRGLGTPALYGFIVLNPLAAICYGSCDSVGLATSPWGCFPLLFTDQKQP